ncbi:hypothetical protein [Streptomyces scabiei]|uniref:hypothetical protein n=1 Tax=Streptomyces scabiei TaxID=1930 RepID=UPI001B30181C|nr:hypothetical protein [Streptomyces sp. LBUM 1475]QTU64253.1 hypothetical protein F3K22_27460 [Streptomyces sp. LBUM 1475]
MNQNASRADIVTLLRAGLSNLAIARQLRCDKGRVRRIREESGLPPFVPAERTRTVEDKWRRFALPVDDGHMEWTGERVGPAGSPVMRYKETSYSPTAIAFEMRHGRPPKGYAIADCGRDQCVAPDHVDDEAGRLAKREEIRRARGHGDRPGTCLHGHDQNEHGRLQGDGTPYCEACKRERKTGPGPRRDARAAATGKGSRPRRKAFAADREARRAARAAAAETTRRDIEKLLRAGMPQLQIARRLHVATVRVQRTREALGLPAPDHGARARYSTLAEAFGDNTAPDGDGHLKWTGPQAPGSPTVCFLRRRLKATRVSFELHHGRPPVGTARPACGMTGCLAGAHLADRPMREANQRADMAYSAIFGKSA